jgi:hypothetical protein
LFAGWLQIIWVQLGLQPQDVTLHYLNGQVRVEVRVPLDAMEDMEAARRFSRAMAETAYEDEFVTEVMVVYS